MSTICDDVAGVIASGDSLGEAHRHHIESCPRCGELAELPAQLAVASEVNDSVEPGAGFTSRVTHGAMEVLGRRKRNRVLVLATSAASAAAVVVALAFGIGGSGSSRPDDRVAAELPLQPQPAGEPDAVVELMELSDVDSALRFTADWDYIEAPLAPTRMLVEEGELE